MRDILLQCSGVVAIVAALIHGVLSETKVFPRVTIEPQRLRTLFRFVWQVPTVAWIAGGVLLYRATKQRAKVVPRRSAYEEAVAKLGVLEQRGAPEAADADGGFVELSSVIRTYLEHRYEIRAPELTTEEFLLVAVRNEGLTTDHRALLTAFLERCDRVKFAGYRFAEG